MRLDKMGYRGDYSFEVFNDDYQQMPMERVCALAFRMAEAGRRPVAPFCPAAQSYAAQGL
jgi:predicted xylose isomerase-like sugar epimerase